jgi:hypothetical protein
MITGGDQDSLMLEEAAGAAESETYLSANGEAQATPKLQQPRTLTKTEERFNQMIKYRMSQINKENLDYLYVKLPHKNEWKRYYVRYHNSQLLFYSSVKVSLSVKSFSLASRLQVLFHNLQVSCSKVQVIYRQLVLVE